MIVQWRVVTQQQIQSVLGVTLLLRRVIWKMDCVFVHLNKKVYEHGKNSVLMPFANNCVFNSFFVSWQTNGIELECSYEQNILLYYIGFDINGVWADFQTRST